MGFLFNRKKGSFLLNGEYAHILSTGGCIYFLENFGNFWKTQGNLREFFSTALVDTMYSQLEKEALAIVYVLSQFYDYLWGQANFTLVTDHKPLLGLFSNTKSIPAQASGRIQRWALALQSYNFSLIHRLGKLLGSADALSRLPLPSTVSNSPIPAEWGSFVNFLDFSPVSSKDVEIFTRRDPLLSKVYKNIEKGGHQKL